LAHQRGDISLEHLTTVVVRIRPKRLACPAIKVNVEAHIATCAGRRDAQTTRTCEEIDGWHSRHITPSANGRAPEAIWIAEGPV
jgi:hypothetical protein